MNNKPIDVSISLCTYKRPELLKQCLEHLLCQATSRKLEIIVVDNDAEGPAKSTIDAFQTKANKRGIRLRYFVEPEQNIALARNKGISESEGEYVAFIDDDEYASDDWLENLCETIETFNVDGVFGPVIPVFPDTFPLWMKNSNLFKRKRFTTGQRIISLSCRTSNALIRKSILQKRIGPFDRNYGRTGGSDTELFCWLEQQGCTFCWCDEANVYEVLEEKRMYLKWHFVRGYRGGWTFSRRKFQTQGRVLGSLFIILTAILGTAKHLFNVLSNLNNLKAAFYLLLSGMAVQIGKIGYFIGFKIEEYKNRKNK